MLFIRMIGLVMERKNWGIRTEHAAQYASLLTPYRMRLTALHLQVRRRSSPPMYILCTHFRSSSQLLEARALC
jgi:hypothetical protein